MARYLETERRLMKCRLPQLDGGVLRHGRFVDCRRLLCLPSFFHRIVQVAFAMCHVCYGGGGNRVVCPCNVQCSLRRRNGNSHLSACRQFVGYVGGSTLDDNSEILGGVSSVMGRLDTDSEEGIGLKELRC